MWLRKNERKRKVCPKYAINKTKGKQLRGKKIICKKYKFMFRKKVSQINKNKDI